MLIDILIMILGCVLIIVAAPGAFELAWLTLGGILPPKPLASTDDNLASLRFCFVVPAHDEGSGVADCVRSLRQCEKGIHDFAVVVIADNCSDDTAKHAEAAGARVLIRQDPHRRGKGFALSHAFQLLLQEHHDVFIVVDADTRVEPHLLLAMAPLFLAGADAAQSRYLASNPDATLRTRLMHVAWLAYNILRPRGREYWGCSVNILGNGFALARKALENVPFDADSIAEDLDYHIRFVESGRRVRFCESTTVWAPAPSTGAVASAQRARWEGGRFRMMKERLPGLLRAIGRGEWRLVEPALDLLLLPLAFQVLLFIALALLPWPPARLLGLAGLGIVTVHVIAAMLIGRAGPSYWLALASAPFYILWKLTLGKRLLAAASKNAAWVRTERSNPHD